MSFDVAFPDTWKLPKKYVDEQKVAEQESSVPNHRLFSFISEINETEIEKNSNNIQNIINYNLEREEKEKLFQTKVEELKILFEKQNLKSLKSLKFDIKIPKIQLQDDEEEIKSDKLV